MHRYLIVRAHQPSTLHPAKAARSPGRRRRGVQSRAGPGRYAPTGSLDSHASGEVLGILDQVGGNLAVDQVFPPDGRLTGLRPITGGENLIGNWTAP